MNIDIKSIVHEAGNDSVNTYMYLKHLADENKDVVNSISTVLQMDACSKLFDLVGATPVTEISDYATLRVRNSSKNLIFMYYCDGEYSGVTWSAKDFIHSSPLLITPGECESYDIKLEDYRTNRKLLTFRFALVKDTIIKGVDYQSNAPVVYFDLYLKIGRSAGGNPIKGSDYFDPYRIVCSAKTIDDRNYVELDELDYGTRKVHDIGWASYNDFILYECTALENGVKNFPNFSLAFQKFEYEHDQLPNGEIEFV